MQDFSCFLIEKINQKVTVHMAKYLKELPMNSNLKKRPLGQIKSHKHRPYWSPQQIRGSVKIPHMVVINTPPSA